METPTKKYLRCPHCGQPSLFSEENPYRPFCTERCKTIDLGDWASDKYAIPIETKDNIAEIDTDVYEDEF